jgi:heme/copper-type cytochrome/quinol oxidase subunit 3
MVVEGVTLAICVGTYFYLRRNFENWPPLRSPRPSLVMPTVGLLVLLAGLVPTYFYKRAAERLERRATHLWLWGSTLALVAATVIRVFEFFALGVRWDLNAYASATWAIVFAHFTLLLASAGETATIAFMFLVGADEMKHFPDASDNAMYYNFLVLAWIPLWAIVYLLPRWV